MGDGNKVEMLVAICALVASAMAVFMTWDQGRVMRAQQHGAVYPVLQVDGYVSRTPDTLSMGIRVSNSGVGPALIEKVTLLFDGEPVEGFQEARRQLHENYDLSWSGLTGRALAPGEEIEPVRVIWARDEISTETFDATALEWSRFNLEICYCSVFDRCWETRSIGTSRSDRVKRCEASEKDVFAELGGTTSQAPDTMPPEADSQ